MKIIYYFFCLFCFIACQADFDELKDSQQRYITFSFDINEMFSNVLLFEDGRFFEYDGVPDLAEDYRLRLVLYCYNHSDSLICTQTILSKTLNIEPVKVQHLQRGTSCHFVFVADIVKFDPYVGYYETWYQLGTGSWSDFYVYSDKRNEDASYNSIAFAELDSSPNNQIVHIILKPITYNGFIVFTHFDKLDRLKGYIEYNMSFNLKTLQFIPRGSVSSVFDFSDFNQPYIIKPVSLNYSDSIVRIMLGMTTEFGVDSIYVDIHNEKREPFVATFDCEEQLLENCKYY